MRLIIIFVHKIRVLWQSQFAVIGNDPIALIAHMHMFAAAVFVAISIAILLILVDIHIIVVSFPLSFHLLIFAFFRSNRRRRGGGRYRVLCAAFFILLLWLCLLRSVCIAACFLCRVHILIVLLLLLIITRRLDGIRQRLEIVHIVVDIGQIVVEELFVKPPIMLPGVFPSRFDRLLNDDGIVALLEPFFVFVRLEKQHIVRFAEALQVFLVPFLSFLRRHIVLQHLVGKLLKRHWYFLVLAVHVGFGGHAR
mmetsp:Transcript_75264/g.119652  ORF Transcript_75264/g.119652 Transcript_75264/m.119652 type:complete len:252 (-) Transcript_75264:514-1269(-)